MKDKDKIFKKYIKIPLYTLLLCVFTLSFIQKGEAQTVSWASGYPRQNPTQSTVLDTTYIEVKFSVDANASNSNVVFTLPTGVVRSGSSEILSENNASVQITSSNTVNVGNLTNISVVHFRIPVKINCNMASNANLKVDVKKSSSLMTNGAKTVSMTSQTPTLNALVTNPIQNYPTGNETKTYTVKLNSLNGNISDFKLVFRGIKYAGLKNFKLNGTLIPESYITKRAVSFDSVYTVIINRDILQANKLSFTEQTLTVEAFSYSPCGTKTITIGGWYPASANANSNNPEVAPSSACGTIQDGLSFTMILNAASGVPNLSFQTRNWLAPHNTPDKTCYDGVTTNFASYTYKNTSGSENAYNSVINIHAGGGETVSMGLAYMDTANIYYTIQGQAEKKISAQDITVILSLSDVSRTVKSAYQDKPYRVHCNITEAIPAGKTIVIRFGRKMGQFYDENTSSADVKQNYQQSVICEFVSTTNSCGERGTIQNSSSTFTYTGPNITMQPADLSVRANQTGITIVSGLRTGSLVSPVNSPGQSIELFVKIPSWMSADTDVAKPIEWVSDNTIDIWPSTYTNHGNGLYSIKLEASDNVNYKFDNGFLRFYYKTGNCMSNTQNYEDQINYWLNYNTFTTTATACRPTLTKLGLAYQKVTLLCKEDGVVIEDFHLHRTSKGWKDSNNDGIPDNGTIAPDNELDHNLYMIGDKGYVLWKGSIEGNASTTYTNLYALLTTEDPITISSNGTNNWIAPDGQNIIFKINGANRNQDLSYVRVGNNQCYLKYIGSAMLKGGDQIEIQLPFKITNASTIPSQSSLITSECFVSNSVSSNPFNNPVDRHGDDVFAQSAKFRRFGPVVEINNALIFNNNNVINAEMLVTTTYSNWYTSPWHAKEYYPAIPEKFYWIVPEGYEVTDPNVFLRMRRFQGNVSDYTMDTLVGATCYMVADTCYMDLLTFFDANYFGSGTITTGKKLMPDDCALLYPRFKVRATKAAPLGTYRIIKGFTVKNIINGETVIGNSGSSNFVYNGTGTTLTSSVSKLISNNIELSIPVLTVGNPSDVDIQNVWLYVDGPVNNVSLNNGAISGQGYQNRWLSVSVNMLSGSSVSFSFKANYTGSNHIGDEVKIYVVSGYTTNWIPTITNTIDLTDIEHGGASKVLPIEIAKANIGGTLSLSSSAGENVIEHNNRQTLTVKLNSFGNTGSVSNAKMTITVPAGQYYYANSAKIAYPSNAAAQPVHPTYEAELLARINVNYDSDRTFDIDLCKALNNNNALISGDGSQENREALFTMQFTPNCETDLTGIRYSGVVNGKSILGTIATGTGNVVYTQYQYPKLSSNYTFSAAGSFTGASVVGPINTRIDYSVNITKTSGILFDIATTDSLEITMHKSFRITGASFADGSMGNIIINNGTVSGNTRRVVLAFPSNHFNQLPNRGVNAVASYKLQFTYNPSEYSLGDGDTQPITARMISKQKFAASCNERVAVMAVKDATVGVLIFDPYPKTVCTGVPTQVNIVNNSGIYEYNWFKSLTSLGTGANLTYNSTTLQRDTIRVEVKKNGTLLGSVNYNYETYPIVTANFKSDSVCFGFATTITNQTMVGGVLGNSSNVSSWAWYKDGESIPFSSDQNPIINLTEGSHQIRLDVTSINGCTNSTTKEVYVKSRVIANFTANAACIGNTTTFTNTSNPTSGVTWEWEFGDGGESTQINPTHTYANTGSFNAKLTATTSMGCTDSKIKTVYIYSLPTFNVNPISRCGTGNIDLNTAISNVVGGTVKFYSNSAATTEITNPASVNVTANKTFYAKVINTTTTCESEIKSIVVTVNTIPTISVTNISICGQGTVNLSNAITAINNGAAKYYSNSTGTAEISTPTAVNVSANTTFYVKAINITTGCESAIKSFTVTVNSLPTFSTTDISICSGSNANLTNAVSNVVGGVVKYYSDATASTEITSPTSVSVSTTRMYYAKAINSTTTCESAIKSFTVIVNPLPTFDVNPISRCGTGNINLNTAISNVIGGTVKFYSNSTATTEVTNPASVNVTANKTYYAKAINATTTCESEIKSIVVTVNTIPSLTTSNITICGSGIADLTSAVTNLQNGVAKYYSNSTATAEISTPTTVNVSSNTTFYVKAINTTTGCESAIKSFTVTLNSLPTFNTTDISICSGSNANLTNAVSNVVGGTVKYYSDATANTEITSPTSVTVSTTRMYYAKAINSTTTCESAIKSFTVIVNPLPTFDVNPISRCGTGNINLNTAISNVIGGTVKFYSNSTATTEVTNPASVNVTADIIYYAKAINTTTTCESAIKSIVVTVNTIPSLTTSNITICGSGIADLTSAVTNLQNGVAKYYSNSTATTEISTPSSVNISTTTTYYVKAINSITGCESIIKSFVVNVNSLPTFNTDDISICSGNTANLTNAVSNIIDGTVKYYSDATANTEIANPTSVIVSVTRMYYAKAINSTTTCESAIKSFTVIVNPLPTFDVNPISRCGTGNINLNTAISNVIGGTVKFYSNSTATTEVTNPASVNVTADITYYAKAINTTTTCESAIKSIVVTVNTIPSLTTSNITICGSGIADLTSAVTNLQNGVAKYYSNSTATTEISTPSSVNISTTTTYYVKAINSITGCESIIKSFVVNVNSLPTFNTDDISICSGNTANLTNAVSNIIDGTVKYYSDATANTEIANPTSVIVSVTRMYYAKAINTTTNCESAIKSFTVVVNPLPTFDVNSISRCGAGIVNLNTAVSNVIGGNVKFYSDASASTEIINPATFNVLSTDTYYAKVVNSTTTCESVIKSFVVTVNVLPDFSVEDLSICGVGTINLTNAVSNLQNGVVKYYSNSTATAEITIPSSVSISNTTTYYAKAINSITGCESTIKSILVTVNPLPVFTITNPSPICEGTSVDLNTTINYSTGTTARFHSDNSGIFELGSSVVSPTTTTQYFIRIEDDITNCLSSIQVVNVEVKPTPRITNTNLAEAICTGNQTTGAILVSSINQSSFTWTGIASSSEINGHTISGSGNLPAEIITNTASVRERITYTVTPHYNGCSGNSIDYVINIDPETKILALSSNTQLCEGSPLQLSVDAQGTQLSYQWYLNSHPIPGAQLGSHSITSLTLEDHGNFSVTIVGKCGTVHSNLINVIVQPTGLLIQKWNDVILVDNSSNEFTAYQWYKNGVAVDGATKQFYSETSALNGTYSVLLTKKDGTRINTCDKLIVASKKTEFSVYPNPLNQGEEFTVEIQNNQEECILNYEIQSSLGTTVKQGQKTGHVFTINTNDIASGMYIIKITTDSGDVYMEKIIVR